MDNLRTIEKLGDYSRRHVEFDISTVNPLIIPMSSGSGNTFYLFYKMLTLK